MTLKPFLMMLHTAQEGMELHKLEEPLRPSEHIRAVQWKRRSSLPSAAQRGCFLGRRPALALMVSLYSSNLDMVLGVFWTFNMRSILQTGMFFFSQLDWNMISTMFLLVSSAPSSHTVQFIFFIKIRIFYNFVPFLDKPIHTLTYIASLMKFWEE